MPLDLVALTSVPTLRAERSGDVIIRVVPEHCQLLLSRRYVGDGLKQFDFRKAAVSAESELAKTGCEHVIGVEWKWMTAASPAERGPSTRLVASTSWPSS